MGKEVIKIGDAIGDENPDNVDSTRASFDKCNKNFTELYGSMLPYISINGNALFLQKHPDNKTPDDNPLNIELKDVVTGFFDNKYGSWVYLNLLNDGNLSNVNNYKKIISITI